MRKINYKALMAILTIGRRSKKNIDWTLAIAIFSTMVTVGLILLYFWQGRPDPQ
jgi:low temperature requirement protein LtrA